MKMGRRPRRRGTPQWRIYSLLVFVTYVYPIRWVAEAGVCCVINRWLYCIPLPRYCCPSKSRSVSVIFFKVRILPFLSFFLRFLPSSSNAAGTNKRTHNDDDNHREGPYASKYTHRRVKKNNGLHVRETFKGRSSLSAHLFFNNILKGNTLAHNSTYPPTTGPKATSERTNNETDSRIRKSSTCSLRV